MSTPGWCIAIMAMGMALHGCASTSSHAGRNDAMSRDVPVVYFEIPATDLDRAIDFYSALLGVAIERTTIDGHAMGLFPEVGDREGISGAIATGESYVPSVDGTRIYFKVDDVRATLAQAVQLGGKELYPPTQVGPQTVVAEFKDCEGNRVALIQRVAPER
jgi:predicted enzyme related to lactoylglutathione lyase